MTDKCREEFEGFFEPKVFERSGSGDYKSMTVQYHYKTWKAAWEASRLCMTTRDI